MSSFTTPFQAELAYLPYERRNTWIERFLFNKPEKSFKEEQVWKLTESFEYYRSDDETDVITVPKGFVTDLASIPRCLWSIYPPFGKYAKAAVIHDYLYYYGIGTKKEADLIFKEAMGVLGVNHLTQALLYQAVKWFGKGNFNKPTS